MIGTAGTQQSILDHLVAIRSEAENYFETAAELLLEDVSKWESEHEWIRGPIPDLFRSLDPEIQKQAQKLSGRLAELAQQTAPAIRRAPLLSEADERAAGHAFKGMRAALRFRQFEFQDIEVLHDEGSVLGVQPPSEQEQPIIPQSAAKEFELWYNDLVKRLELADLQPTDGADLPLTASRPLTAGIRPGTAFIMMWISDENPELEDVCNKIKECFRRFNIIAKRADEIEHEGVITQRILDEIKTSEFLIADITGERPSVYYEIGYAHALARRIMMYRKSGTKIHFDIAGYNCPEYKNVSALDKMLMQRLEYVTGGPASTL